MKVKYNKKDLYIVHVEEDRTYVLATYNSDKKSQVFKLDVESLDLSKAEKSALTKFNSKTNSK